MFWHCIGLHSNIVVLWCMLLFCQQLILMYTLSIVHQGRWWLKRFQDVVMDISSQSMILRIWDHKKYEEFWHLTVVLLTLIRQGGLWAWCQDTLCLIRKYLLWINLHLLILSIRGKLSLTFVSFVVVTYTPGGMLWLNARTLGWGIPHQGGGERRSAHPTFIILHIYTFKLWNFYYFYTFLFYTRYF